MLVSYTLPPPLTLNTIYRAVNGRNIKSKKYRDWCEEADWQLQMQGPEPLGDGPFFIHYSVPIVHWRTGRKVGSNSDIDNRIKCLADAIVRAEIIPDDSMKYVVGFRAVWKRREDSLVLIQDAVDVQA